MALGPGKFDDECTAAMIATGSKLAVLVLAGGPKGSGFSVVTRDPVLLFDLPHALRLVADQIEKDLET